MPGLHAIWCTHYFRAQMSRFSQPLTHLIHEKLSVVMTFAFSRSPLQSLRDSKFKGEWEYLDRALFTVSEQKAELACLELATFLRLLDDDENITEYLRKTHSHSYGRAIKEGQSDEPLYLRDLTNKIIHAHHLEWNVSEADNPKLLCISREPQRWLQAEIELLTDQLSNTFDKYELKNLCLPGLKLLSLAYPTLLSSANPLPNTDAPQAARL